MMDPESIFVFHEMFVPMKDLKNCHWKNTKLYTYLFYFVEFMKTFCIPRLFFQ